LEIQKGSLIADFGSGPGYFTIPLAKAVGDDGKVYALDVLTSALETVDSKAKMLGLSNIFTKRVNLEKEGGSKIENESVNWIIMKDILFQNKNKEIILKEAYRILKNEGKVLVIEWDKPVVGVGPEQNLRIETEDLKRMIIANYFKIEKKIETGNFHYGLLLVK
jgi:ubiquinone/menaquinone biosynthesis C-methylase UbiE